MARGGGISVTQRALISQGVLAVVDVFVDRDGVINRNRPDHVKSWSEFRFLSGSVEALVRLTRAGHRTFVITNQAIVNRGVVSAEVVATINRRMAEEVARHGGCIDAVLLCPHLPEEGCGCRKPMPGLLLQARERLGANLEEAYVIGDFSSDLEAARVAGCTPILVLTGRGRQACKTMSLQGRHGYWVARDLMHAVELIGANGRRGRPRRRDSTQSAASRVWW